MGNPHVRQGRILLLGLALVSLATGVAAVIAGLEAVCFGSDSGHQCDIVRDKGARSPAEGERSPDGGHSLLERLRFLRRSSGMKCRICQCEPGSIGRQRVDRLHDRGGLALGSLGPQSSRLITSGNRRVIPSMFARWAAPGGRQMGRTASMSAPRVPLGRMGVRGRAHKEVPPLSA